MTRPPVLVTGVPGWIGNRLLVALTDGLPDYPELRTPDAKPPVRCLVLPSQREALPSDLSDNVEIVEGDITRPETLLRFFKGAENGTVFHGAGIIHPGGRTRPFYAVNVDGVSNMLEGVKRAGIRRFVHLSSNSPFGVNPSPDHRFDERAPYNPYMAYGKSKKLGEDLVNAAGRDGDLETVIVRAPWFYGPGQPARQTTFFSMIRRGRAPLVGRGLNRRSMVYIDNLCAGLLLCARLPQAAGESYWIADPAPYPMSEIIDTIERVLERDFGFDVAHTRLRLPNLASRVAYLLDGLLQGAGLYHAKIHVLSEMNMTIACSTEKAERELGYRPKIGLEEGMRRSIQWVLDQGGRI